MASCNLCYGDHIKTLSSEVQSMLNTSCFCDVTLAVDGKLFKAHQVILAICSPYFEELFMANDCQNNHVTVCILNVKHEIMQALLTFMYEGKVKIQVEDLDLLVTTANELKIKGLEKSCMHSVNMANAPEMQTQTEEAEDGALPLVTGAREEQFNHTSDVLLIEEDEMKMDITDYKTSAQICVAKPVIQDTTAWCKFTSHMVQVENVSDSSKNDLKSAVEDVDNKSMNEENNVNMDIGPTEIQYPNGTDENDESDIDFKSDSDLDENDRSEGYISSNKNEIADDNVCDKNTVTVSFLTKELDQTLSSILVNNAYFSPISNNKWKCIYSKPKCQASIVLTLDKHIIFIGEHNHAVEKSLEQVTIASEETYTVQLFAQKHQKPSTSAGSVTVSFIKSLLKEGWGGIIVNGMRYSRSHVQILKLWSRWQCTVRSAQNCKANVILTNDERIVFVGEHRHREVKNILKVIDLQCTYSILPQEKWPHVRRKLLRRSLASSNEQGENEITCHLKSAPLFNNWHDDSLNTHEQCAEATLDDAQRPSISQSDRQTDKSTEKDINHSMMIGVKSIGIDLSGVDDARPDFEDSDPDPDYSPDDSSDSDEHFKDTQDTLNSKQQCCSNVNTLSSDQTETVVDNVSMLSSLQSAEMKVIVSFVRTYKNQKSTSIIVNDVLYAASGRRTWRCSHLNCRAKILITHDKHIVFKSEHNHAVQKGSVPRMVTSSEPYTVLPFVPVQRERAPICESQLTPMEASFTEGDPVSVSFINSSITREGCSGIIVDRRRYSKSRVQARTLWTRWQCNVSTINRCKAYIILTKDQQIVFGKQHNHELSNKPSPATVSECTYFVLLNKSWPNIKNKLKRCLYNQ